MRLLLDTHVLLWALMYPDRLSDVSSAMIRDRSNELLVSAVSGFEIATKHRIGKLPEASGLLLGYGRALEQLGARELPIGTNHAITAGRLEWSHRDPFDRILAAQSILEPVPLVTSDEAFQSLPGVQTLWK